MIKALKGAMALSFFCTCQIFANDVVPGEFIVKLKNQNGMNVLSSDSVGRVLGGVVKEKFAADQNLLVLKKDAESEDAFEEIQNSDFVEYVEPNYIYHIDSVPNDPQYSKDWGLSNPKLNEADLNVERAWDITKGSKEIVVAIIDSGIDVNHPDLKDNLWVNEIEANGKAGVDDDGNGYIDDIHGYDFVNNKAEPLDDNGHGTHIAGIIGAKGDNGIGSSGVNWNVRIMALKFVDSRGAGPTEAAVNAIDYAIANKANVINASWGGGMMSQALKEAVQRASDAGILFVASAGNNGGDNEVRPHFPGSFDLSNVLAVAAVDSDGNLSDFSCYGASKVQVAAPGVEIFSTYKDSGYEILTGTSMATPYVAGVAALALSAHKMDVFKLRKKLISSVHPWPGLEGKVSSGGVIDAFKAVLP